MLLAKQIPHKPLFHRARMPGSGKSNPKALKQEMKLLICVSPPPGVPSGRNRWRLSQAQSGGNQETLSQTVGWMGDGTNICGSVHSVTNPYWTTQSFYRLGLFNHFGEIGSILGWGTCAWNLGWAKKSFCCQVSSVKLKLCREWDQSVKIISNLVTLTRDKWF